jgi:hypothetical protein
MEMVQSLAPHVLIRKARMRFTYAEYDSKKNIYEVGTVRMNLPVASHKELSS